MSAAGNMPFDKFLKSVEIDLALFEGGRERNDGTVELFHHLSPLKLRDTLPFLKQRCKRGAVKASILSLFTVLFLGCSGVTASQAALWDIFSGGSSGKWQNNSALLNDQ